jgi:hypothetical protein
MPKEHWKTEPDEKDFESAANYLSLILPAPVVGTTVAALRTAPLAHGEASDLLRASTLHLLGDEDALVRKDLAKVKKGKKLPPVLLVRGSLANSVPLTVADGYHRICASYAINEDELVPYRIVDLA